MMSLNSQLTVMLSSLYVSIVPSVSLQSVLQSLVSHSVTGSSPGTMSTLSPIETQLYCHGNNGEPSQFEPVPPSTVSGTTPSLREMPCSALRPELD